MPVLQEISDCTGFPLLAVIFLQIWRLAVVLLQYLGKAFEYVGPIRFRRIPDKDERRVVQSRVKLIQGQCEI